MNPHELDFVITFIQQHPDDAARELEIQTHEVAVKLIGALPLKQGHQLIAHMLPPYAARLFEELLPNRAAVLLAELNANQATAILRCIPNPKRDELLKSLPEKSATLCRLLMNYSKDTVGAWMTTDIVILPARCLVNDALKRLTPPDCPPLHDTLPVTNNEKHLVGLLHIQDLLRANEGTQISHLVNEAPFTLSSRISLSAAARHEGWRHSDTLPVLNRNRELVGLLRHLDLRRSLGQFDDISAAQRNSDLLTDVGELYVRTLCALAGLFDKKQRKGLIKGESL